MAEGFDLVQDLVSLAGEAKTAITGQRSKYTALSSVLGATAQRVQKYNDTRNVLQAQRDIASGVINQGLAEESKVYNITVLHNGLEKGKTEMLDRIKNREFSNIEPLEFEKQLREESENA